MIRIGFGAVLVATLSLGATAGCKHSLVAETWGDAQRENVARQIANPEAGQVQPDQPAGLDAMTAGQVTDNYRRDQKQAGGRGELPSFGEFEVGGGAAGSGGR